MTDNRIKIYNPGWAFIGSAVDVDNAQRLQELWIEFNQPERAGGVQWKAHLSRRHSGIMVCRSTDGC